MFSSKVDSIHLVIRSTEPFKVFVKELEELLKVEFETFITDRNGLRVNNADRYLRNKAMLQIGPFCYICIEEHRSSPCKMGYDTTFREPIPIMRHTYFLRFNGIIQYGKDLKPYYEIEKVRRIIEILARALPGLRVAVLEIAIDYQMDFVEIEEEISLPLAPYQTTRYLYRKRQVARNLCLYDKAAKMNVKGKLTRLEYVRNFNYKSDYTKLPSIHNFNELDKLLSRARKEIKHWLCHRDFKI